MAIEHATVIQTMSLPMSNFGMVLVIYLIVQFLICLVVVSALFSGRRKP
jgi:hypothetical protein